MTNDRKILRDLAVQYREIAHTDQNLRNKELHIAVNDLHMIRPIILMDEIPWHELNGQGELTLQCEDPFLQEIERSMRQTLYRFRHFQVDMVVPEALRVTKVIHTSGIGIDIKEETLAKDHNNRIVSHRFFDQMEDESCLEQIHKEVITYDKEESERRYHLVQDLVGDIVPVKLIGDQWCFDTLWDDVARLRGVGNLLEDLIERPEYMHAIAQKLTDVFLDKVRQYEELNLFEGCQDLLHSTAAYTDQLPGKDCDGVHFKAKDVWGRGAAQVFVSASPAMREEFDIPYMARAMEPFGLVYYGCCEPLHNQIDNLAKIPHLRKITVTPWAKYELAAEQIGKRYVYSAKANPANVAMSNFNEDVIRAELKRITDACYKYNCNFELVLKDISTVSYHPENLERWAKIAQEYIRNI